MQFYKQIDVFTQEQCADILEACTEWRQGWCEKFSWAFRSDQITDYYSDWAWNCVKRHMTATKVYPVDWVYNNFRILKFTPGTSYSWHCDVIPKQRISNRSRNIIVVLKKGISAVIETQQGIFDLAQGKGIQFPIQDYYQIIGPHVTREKDNDFVVLNGWGMQRLSDVTYNQNFN